MLLKLDAEIIAQIHTVLYEAMDDPDHMQVKTTYDKINKIRYTKENFISLSNFDIAVILISIRNAFFKYPRLEKMISALANRFIIINDAYLDSFIDMLDSNNILISKTFGRQLQNLNTAPSYIIDTIKWTITRNTHDKKVLKKIS